MDESNALGTHRRALALAAMLAITAVTAIAALGGLTRWNMHGSPAATAPPVTLVQQQTPPAPAGELDD